MPEARRETGFVFPTPIWFRSSELEQIFVFSFMLFVLCLNSLFFFGKVAKMNSTKDRNYLMLQRVLRAAAEDNNIFTDGYDEMI